MEVDFEGEAVTADTVMDSRLQRRSRTQLDTDMARGKH